MNTEDRDDRLDHEDITDAERQEIEGSTDEGASAPAAAKPADAPPPAADEGDDEPSAIREAAQALRDAAKAMQEAGAKAAPAAEQEAEPPPPARDFQAELAALREKYDNGELEQAEYLDARDEIRDARLREQILQEQLQATQEQAQQVWAKAYTAFASDEANQRLMSGVLKPGFDQLALQNVQAGMGYEEALTAARDAIFDQLGIAKPGAAEKADKVADATAARAPRERPGPTLGDAPAAARDAGTNPNDDWDNLPIEELEARLAKASPERIEAYLAEAPGGLRDNPKYRGD